MESFNNFDELMIAMPKLAAEIDDYSANTDCTGWKNEPIYVSKDHQMFQQRNRKGLGNVIGHPSLLIMPD